MKLYYKIYYIGANTVFGHVFPFVFLVILNILIVRTLNKRPKPGMNANIIYLAMDFCKIYCT